MWNNKSYSIAVYSFVFYQDYFSVSVPLGAWLKTPQRRQDDRTAAAAAAPTAAAATEASTT